MTLACIVKIVQCFSTEQIHLECALCQLQFFLFHVHFKLTNTNISIC